METRTGQAKPVSWKVHFGNPGVLNGLLAEYSRAGYHIPAMKHTVIMSADQSTITKETTEKLDARGK